MVADNPNFPTPPRTGAKKDNELVQLRAQVEQLNEHVHKAQQHALEMGNRALELAAQEVELRREVEYLESLVEDRYIRTVIIKRRSVGATWLCVAPSKPTVKLHHFLLYFPALSENPGREFAVLVGEIALVHYAEPLAGEVYDANYVQVVYQRPADVVDLSAAIFKVRIGQEEGGVSGLRARSDVDQAAPVVLPDSMEFRLDHEPWSLPDGPAYKLFSTLSDHLLWNDAETFAHWFAGQGFAWDEGGRLVRRNVTAEVGDVG